MAVKTLEDALVHELQDLLYAEKQLTKAIPKMAKKTSDPELKQCLDAHVLQTKGQVERLEKALEIMNGSVRSKKCESMVGIIKEGEETVGETSEPQLLDSLIVASSQKVEHYEISSYTTVCAWADMLGRTDVKRLMEQTLTEEMETEQKLAQLSKSIGERASATA